MSNKNPLICAIDTKDIDAALELCGKIKPLVGLVKLGLEFFTINGPEGVLAIKKCGVPIFLDLKFHDIPNTVAESVRCAVSLGVQILTIHTSGGKAMMKAAVLAAKEESARLGIEAPILLGVTVLTSMDSGDLKDIGITKDVESQVASLAKLAKESGLDGVVCSPLEIEIIKKECGKEFTLVVPGIRSDISKDDDQKRVITPKKAIEYGADFIVVGRPITKALDPIDAIKNILLEIKTESK